MYLALKMHQVNVSYKDSWVVKIFLKIKVFCVSLFKNRGWEGDETYRFCTPFDLYYLS
jgi:hypothetical protein